MKTLARMVDKKVLVEMTQDEHDVFYRLQSACEGVPLINFNFYNIKEMDSDLENVFNIIDAYVSTKFHINAMRNDLNLLEKTLEGDKK